VPVHSVNRGSMHRRVHLGAAAAEPYYSPPFAGRQRPVHRHHLPAGAYGYKQPTAGFDTNSKLEATPCPPDGPLAYVESEEPDFSTPGEERSKARWSVRGSRHGRENPSQASSDLITLPLSASMIPKSFPLLFFRVKKKEFTCHLIMCTVCVLLVFRSACSGSIHRSF
jgi:hypothetical protein